MAEIQAQKGTSAVVAIGNAFEGKAMTVGTAANSAVHQDGGRASAWDPYEVWLNRVHKPRAKTAAARVTVSLVVPDSGSALEPASGLNPLLL